MEAVEEKTRGREKARSMEAVEEALCFIVFAIFSSLHMIAIFLPSSIYSAIPPLPQIAQKEALHPVSGLLFLLLT